MARFGILVLLLAPAGLAAQTPFAPLGLKVGKVPDSLYAQLPQLPKDQCCLVEDVEPDSRAARVGLRRFDVIVSLDKKTVADARSLEEQLGRLKKGQKALLSVVRAGKKIALPVDAHRTDNADANLKASAKGGEPPAVTIQFQPMDHGRLNLVLTYASAVTGKMERLAYIGQLAEIERQIQTDFREQRLPERVQDLVEVALERVRTINESQK
jgi:hypothetical protein